MSFRGDDDDDDSGSRSGKRPAQQKKRQRLLPDEFALLPRQVRIDLLSKLDPADVEPFCAASAQYSLIYCGVTSRDAPEYSVPDKEIVFEHWLNWLERDYGVHGDPNRCRAFSSAERRWVAASMVRYIPPGTSNLEQLRKLRGLYNELHETTGDSGGFFTLPLHHFWYYRDGIAIVSEDYYFTPKNADGSRSEGDGRYIAAVSIVDLARRRMDVVARSYGARDDEEPVYTVPVFVLMPRTPNTTVLAVIGSDVHSGAYLVLEQPAGNYPNNLASNETLVYVGESSVSLGNAERGPYAFRDRARYQVVVNPISPAWAYAIFEGDQVYALHGDERYNVLRVGGEPTIKNLALFMPIRRVFMYQLAQREDVEQNKFGITRRNTPELFETYQVRYNLQIGGLRLRIGGPVMVQARVDDEAVDDNNNNAVPDQTTVRHVYKYKVERLVPSPTTSDKYEWETTCFTINDDKPLGAAKLTRVRVFIVPVVRRFTSNQSERFDARIVAVFQAEYQVAPETRKVVRVDNLYLERIYGTPRVLVQHNNVMLPPESSPRSVVGILNERTLLFVVPGAYQRVRQLAEIVAVKAPYEANEGTLLAAFDFLNGEYREMYIDRLNQYYLMRAPYDPFMRLTVLDNDLTSLRVTELLRVLRAYNQNYGVRNQPLINAPRPCYEDIAEQYDSGQFKISYE